MCTNSQPMSSRRLPSASVRLGFGLEAVRSSVCEAGLVGCCLVGDSVSEVDLERPEGGCPVHHSFPFDFGSHEREVDELGRGLLVGEVTAGLDRFADLAVEAFDRV